MKRFLIVVCLASAIPASSAVAGSFPWWFHTRPKPVLVDDQPSKPADTRNRAPNRGTANFLDDHRIREKQQAKSWLAGFFARDRSNHRK